MLHLRSYVLVLLTIIAFHASSNESDSKWYKVPAAKPEHFFQTVTYLSTNLSFRDIQLLRLNASNYDDIKSILAPELTGGQYLYVHEFKVDKPSDLVVDFALSTHVANFWHRVYTTSGKLVHQSAGGTYSSLSNEFFLRHGRTMNLAEGNYLLVSEFAAPFFIAQPTPTVLDKSEYIESIKLTNTVSLIGLGIFIGLGLYYAVMGVIRRRALDGFYATFILSNLIFNSATLLVFSDVFNVSWFYFASATISFSNIFYVLFVWKLFDISSANKPWLSKLTALIITIMTGLMLYSYFVDPTVSNEHNRLGVLVFALFGLVTAFAHIRDPRHKVTARLYLAANLGFLGPALIATLFPHVWSAHTTYASHWGIMAVAIEVILLSFLLSYQLSRVYKERNYALHQAEKALLLAKTDKLTEIPNRLAMEERLNNIKSDCSFVFIDLDGVKGFNDRFGHSMGDSLLKTFALVLEQNCSEVMYAFRQGGDEFALIIEQNCFIEDIEAHLNQILTQVRNIGFDDFSLSYGLARMEEVDDKGELVKLADSRMYEYKQRSKNFVSATDSVLLTQ